MSAFDQIAGNLDICGDKACLTDGRKVVSAKIVRNPHFPQPRLEVMVAGPDSVRIWHCHIDGDGRALHDMRWPPDGAIEARADRQCLDGEIHQRMIAAKEAVEAAIASGTLRITGDMVLALAHHVEVRP